MILCMLACHSSSTSEKRFSFSPEPGKKYFISTKHEMKDSWFYEKLQKTYRSVQIDMQFELVDTKDSLFQFTLTFADFKIKQPPITVIIGKTTTVFKVDSISPKENNTNNPMQFDYYLLGLTKGLSMKVWMNKKGEVLKVDGFDKIADSVSKISGHDKKEVRYLLKEYLGEKIVTDYLNELFCIAPDYYEKEGDSWVRNITFISKAPVKLSSMYKIEKIHDDSLFLSQNAVISGRANENAEPFMTGRQNGKLIVDRKTGIPYSYNAESDTKTKTSSYIDQSTQIFTATVK